jgi:hypothetical protein
MSTSISIPNKRLTPSMLTTLQHLADRKDQALVRLYSNYWVAESDAGTNAEIRDMNGRLEASGNWLLAGEAPPVVIVRTPTVKAMVTRRLLKFVGPKRPILAAGTRMDYSRAVLTAHATEIRQVMEDQSQAAYEEVLSRLR